MKFWKRQATLQIGSKRFGMDDLYFKFTVPFEDSEKLGTATIEAYNLSPATRNSIKKGMPIILNAGYEGDIGAIFTGKVSQVSDKHSGTEVITTIAAAEALEEWLSKEVNKTYTAGSKASAIVKDLLNIFGLEVGTMELAVDKEYPRGKVFKWLKKQGGLEAMKERNERKAKILYDYLDQSRLFHGTVRKEDRSIMNVPFVTGDKDLDALFVKEAEAAGFVNLKGHRTVGGMRASIYNAMPEEGVVKLVEFMKKFEAEHADA